MKSHAKRDTPALAENLEPCCEQDYLFRLSRRPKMLGGWFSTWTSCGERKHKEESDLNCGFSSADLKAPSSGLDWSSQQNKSLGFEQQTAREHVRRLFIEIEWRRTNYWALRFLLFNCNMDLLETFWDFGQGLKFLQLCKRRRISLASIIPLFPNWTFHYSRLQVLIRLWILTL